MTIMLATLALVILAASQDAPAQLTAVPFAPHDSPVVALQAGRKGKRLFSMTEAGVVAEWSEKKSTTLWHSKADTFAEENPDAGAIHLSVGDEAATRSTPGPFLAYELVGLADGTVGRRGSAPVSPASLNTQVSVGAIVTDPKDKWVWLGGSDGALVRLMLDNPLTGWSTRGVKNGGVTAMALDSKAKEIAIGGEDGTIRFIGNSSCDVDEKAVFEGHDSPVGSVVWDPSGKTIVSADRKGQIRIHNRRSGKTVRMLAAPGRKLQCLVVHPKGKWLAAGAEDGSIHVWTVKDGALIATCNIADAQGGVTAMCFLKDGKTLFAAAGKSLHRIELKDVGK